MSMDSIPPKAFPVWGPISRMWSCSVLVSTGLSGLHSEVKAGMIDDVERVLPEQKQQGQDLLYDYLAKKWALTGKVMRNWPRGTRASWENMCYLSQWSHCPLQAGGGWCLRQWPASSCTHTPSPTRTHQPIRGQYPCHLTSIDQSEFIIKVTVTVLTNQRSVLRSCDL